MEVESWLLADRSGAAGFLRVLPHRIPEDTDSIPKPKEFLIGLARKSRSRTIRDGLTPRPGSTSRVGPDYNGLLGEFASGNWSPARAAAHSASLKRTVRRIESFACQGSCMHGPNDG